ncbi:GGDEF domain-containing protein [Botrimarina sp.]|uniref:GGDEF domain-containing protein n=1 Tax=Botrimarina sp. TaxID=2795802 RepID=UPI0032ED4F01
MADRTDRSRFPDALLAACERRPAATIFAALGLATLIAVADFLTGDTFPLIVCYLPTIAMVCWVTSPAIGAVLAAGCCVGWLLDDALTLEMQGVTAAEAWVAVSHALFFAIVVGMLARLREAHANERRLARTDGLTGLLNAKAFRERADEEMARSRRTGRPVSVAFIDCDNFKTVNDTLGHLEGDRLLSAIADQMRLTVRQIDMPARMGGDEFAILLPETAQHDAQLVVERLRDDLTRRMQEQSWPVTFSIGVAVYATPPESVDALIHGADTLMYEVKAGAKDAVALKLVA